MKSVAKHITRWARFFACFVFFSTAISPGVLAQQPVKRYTVRDGKMCIELSKDLDSATLQQFIANFSLQELALNSFIRTNRADSLERAGWKVEVNNRHMVVLCKPLLPIDDFTNPGNRIVLTEKHPTLAERFPATNNGIVCGYNRLRNKQFFVTANSEVTFFLRNHANARRVMLAGSFNDWKPDALAMTRTDSGWIARVRLAPGKYWYKFIADGRWMVDNDNGLRENDGQGNTNSVYYRPNITFRLNGFMHAKRVFLSGSFNNWQPRQMEMVRTEGGWQLPVYLSEGTHTYKFVVDGTWYADEKNKERLPDGHGAYNSVLRIGKPHLFALKGYENARVVQLAGSFNDWRTDELLLKKVTGGWELPYVLGPGNYQYKFIVDGKWVSDPANPLTADQQKGNSFLIIQPNYTFRLRGFAQARSVYLAGDFNNWNPNAFPMRRNGDEWIFRVHLSVGKHRYKFIVDGHWILDPGNRLWEQNEVGTGNSILWISR